MSIIDIRRTILKSADDFNSFFEEWSFLERGKDMTVFQSFQWNRSLVEQWFSDRRNNWFGSLEVCSLYCDGVCKIIALLEIYKHTIRMRRFYSKKAGVSLLGGGNTDYVNFIYDDVCDSSIAAIIAYIKKTHRISLKISKLRDDTEVARYLQGEDTHTTSEEVAVFVPISSSPIVLSKSTRQNIRTAKNRMVRDGICFSTEMLLGVQDEALISELIAIHSERLEDRYGKTQQKHNFGFFKREYDIVKENMKGNDQSFFWIVRCNNEIAGYLYGLIDHNAVRIIHNCVEKRYAFYSPMFVGCYELIAKECEKASFEEKQIDFTRGGEEYKFRLGGKAVTIRNYQL